MVVVDDFNSELLATVVRRAGTLLLELEAGVVLWGRMAWKPRDLKPGGNVVMAAFTGIAEAGMGTNLASLGRVMGMWILRFTVIGRLRPLTTSSVKGMEDWIEAAGSEKISFISLFHAALVLFIGELFFSGVKVLRTDF